MRSSFVLGLRQLLHAPPPSPAWFNTGPLQDHDARVLRPYFLVPLDPQHHSERLKVLQDLSDYQRAAEPEEGLITDVFVLSHGWHRNIYGAISAYDRLLSRTLRLARRGQLPPLGQTPGQQRPFHPVFLCLHWHSDPGEDGFVDRAGRRDREDFLRRLAARLEPVHTEPQVADAAAVEKQTANDFESLYALFSMMAAPGRYALTDENVMQQAKELRPLLDRYRIIGGPGDTPAERCAVAWACYHESAPKRLLQDGSPTQREFLSPTQAVGALIKFLFAAVPLTLLLGLIPKLGPLLLGGLRQFVQWLLHEAETVPVAGEPVVRAVMSVWRILRQLAGTLAAIYTGLGAQIQDAFAHQHWGDGIIHVLEMTGLVILTVAPLAVFLGVLDLCVSWKRNSQASRPDDTPEAPAAGFTQGSLLGGLALVAWLVLQVVCAAPLLGWLFVTYLFGFVYNWQWVPQIGLYNERAGRRQVRELGERRNRARKNPSCSARALKAGYLESQPLLAHLARWPAARVLSILREDSPAHSAILSVDCQLAFFEMQQAGVRAGEHAAAFLDDLAGGASRWKELGIPEERTSQATSFASARYYLVGHSFGGLLVANVSRALHRLCVQRTSSEAGQEHPAAPFAGGIHSLCLVQGALGANWFETESELVRWLGQMGTRVACIYSTYDTANGFYYPAGNRGRAAAGFGGLTPPQVTQGRYAALSTAPPAAALSPNPAPFISIDASRLIYDGPPATGGGHVDLYKDDVVYLLWGSLGVPE